MKAAFDWYNDLSSAERQTWNLQEAKEFAYHLVLVRFYQWLSAACKQLMVAGRVSSSLCVFAAEYAGDFFYCVTPENLAGH